MELPCYLSPNPTSGTLSSSDYSSDYLADMNDMAPHTDNNATKSTTQSSQRKSKKKSVSSFIQKLYNMLEDNTNDNLICWNPSGTSFSVCNAKVFAAQVLPAHFKHSNFSSFVRLLNMYGFHKVSKSPRGHRSTDKEIWEFSHPKLVRGRPDLLKNIKRKAMDSEKTRRENSDIQASFTMLRTSQSELFQQFYALQENFTHLLHALDESRKTQQYQGMQIDQLLQQRGLSKDNINYSQPSPPLTYHQRSEESLLARHHDQHDPYHQHTLRNEPFQMMVTTPSASSPGHGYASQGMDSSTLSSYWLNNNDSAMTNLSISQSSVGPIGNSNNNGKGKQQQQPSDILNSPMTFQAAANTPLPSSPNILASPELALSPVSSEDSHGSYAFGFGYPNTSIPH